MLLKLAPILLLTFFSASLFAQTSPIEPGVSQELAKWRAARYSDVRYKLNLTLEKMSPVLKGTIEIQLKVRDEKSDVKNESTSQFSLLTSHIILDWRKIRGSENLSTISNVSINGQMLGLPPPPGFTPTNKIPIYEESNEHLIFRDGVITGENVIKLDFTSPILTSGSAITRYVDKEDGAEYIYSLFVPSDASTAFPVFDQPDLKARFTLDVTAPGEWKVVSNTNVATLFPVVGGNGGGLRGSGRLGSKPVSPYQKLYSFHNTEPISTYIFAFAAGPFADFYESDAFEIDSKDWAPITQDPGTSSYKVTDTSHPKYRRVSPLNQESMSVESRIYLRKSQAAKFKPYAAEVFRLNREGIKYLEAYFDYKFPFPKYDLVLIPEFPFGGMEHAGATFLRESAIIFPQEPTKNDLVSRATLIFHETAHQWFGDTVTMRWFDDLWLKEGFATFTAYKAMEKIMPSAHAWKVFYERIKQGAYQTDATRGTTAIYQPISNLSAAKSAYGNIVYNKAPAYLRQAEFYLGEEKFQTAVRAFLKKHEFGNAGWEDLVREFEEASGNDLEWWAEKWVTERGLPVVRGSVSAVEKGCFVLEFRESLDGKDLVDGWRMGVRSLMRFAKTSRTTDHVLWGISGFAGCDGAAPQLLFPNYRDYGYGIFLLDDKSRDYVLKNIQHEEDDFLRSMMWGALWDSVREGELDPRVFVELVVKVLSPTKAENHPVGKTPPPRSSRKEGSQNLPNQGGEQDESTIQTLLGRVSTALNYYLSDAQRGELAPKIEAVLIDRMQNAPTLGQRITFYRAFLNIASTENAQNTLKQMLGRNAGIPAGNERDSAKPITPQAASVGKMPAIPLKTKDRFDIVTRLLILNDPEAPKLLADLEKTETSDEAKRYAYAAKAGIATAENKAKFWSDFVNNKEISESWIEAAFGPFNSIKHSELTLPYLEKALAELPNLKRSRKIFFVNGWLGAFIGGQRDEKALAIINKFLADNPNLDKDLRLKILENVDLIERAVKIRKKYS